MPTSTSTAPRVTWTPGSIRLSREGSSARRRSSPVSTSRLSPFDRDASSWISLLVSGSDAIAPCTSDNARGQLGVVDGDANTSWDAALPQRFHTGAHRRSDDDREKEEQNDEPDLPHRESQNHEQEQNERRDEHPSRHLLRRQLPSSAR